MRDSSSALDVAVRMVAEERLRTESAHPTPQDLTGYQADSLPQRDMQRIEAHLALCPSCADAVLELVESTAEPQPERPQSVQPRPSATQPFFRSFRFAAMLALAVLASLLAVVLWPSKPIANTNIEFAFLEPRTAQAASDRRDAGMQAKEIPVSEEATMIAFSLAFAEGRVFEAYAVEIQSEPGGESIWRTRLDPMADANFGFEVPVDRLPDGLYSATLSGVTNDGPTLLAQYDFFVRRQAAGR